MQRCPPHDLAPPTILTDSAQRTPSQAWLVEQSMSPAKSSSDWHMQLEGVSGARRRGTTVVLVAEVGGVPVSRNTCGWREMASQTTSGTLGRQKFKTSQQGTQDTRLKLVWKTINLPRRDADTSRGGQISHLWNGHTHTPNKGDMNSWKHLDLKN